MDIYYALALFGLGWALLWLCYELNGGWGRWRSGKPIFKSTHDAKVLAVERERRARRKNEIYAEYDSNPHRLDGDPAFYREFKEHWDWNSIRQDVIREWLRQGGGVCPGCGELIGRRRKLHVDHISPRSKYPSLRYLKSNLQVLCSRCNRIKHDYDGHDWEQVIDQRKRDKKRRATNQYYKNRKARGIREQ